MTDIVIPIKSIATVKSRLRHSLDEPARAGLVLAMLNDLLDTIRQCDVDDVWLVAQDTSVFKMGNRFGTNNIREIQSCGYNHGVLIGLKAVPENRSVLVLPGDIPLTRPQDIDRLIQLQRTVTPAVGIVPDSNCNGTNGLSLSSPRLFSTLFGKDSFHRHQLICKNLGIIPTIIKTKNMALDIDTLGDILSLLSSGRACNTIDFLNVIGFHPQRYKPKIRGIA